MGLRAYFQVSMAEDMDQAQLQSAISELATMPAIESVDPLIGHPFLMVMVDAPITVQALANKIAAKDWVRGIKVMRLVSIFERHRSVKASKMPIFELAGVGAAKSLTDMPQSVSIFQLLGIAGMVMESRAYFLIDTSDDIDQRQFIEAIRDLEEIPGIDYVDPVLGPPDMVVMVDAPNTIEEMEKEIKGKSWVKNLQVLRIASIFPQPTTVLEPAAEVFQMAPESLSVYELLGIKS